MIFRPRIKHQIPAPSQPLHIVASHHVLERRTLILLPAPVPIFPHLPVNPFLKFQSPTQPIRLDPSLTIFPILFGPVLAVADVLVVVGLAFAARVGEHADLEICASVGNGGDVGVVSLVAGEEGGVCDFGGVEGCREGEDGGATGEEKGSEVSKLHDCIVVVIGR